MTGISPSFVFPAPGPSMPPWPVFTDEPSPGQKSFDHMRVYMEHVLDDRNNYPTDGFGSPTASIQIQDILEPIFAGPDDGSDTAWMNDIHAVQIYCLVCLPTKNGEKREETDEVGWPFCGGDSINTQSISNEIIGWSWQPGVVNQGLVIPIPPSGWRSTSLACTLAMYMTFDIVDRKGQLYGNRPNITSQLFLVSSMPREGAPNFGGLMPYRYSVAYPLGTQNGTIQGNGTEFHSTSVYTSRPVAIPVPTPTQDWSGASFSAATNTLATRSRFCAASRYNSCRTDGWYGWSAGKRVGVIIGIVIGVIIILLLIRCCYQPQHFPKRERKRPILLSELRRQQAAEQEAAAERRHVERLHGQFTSPSRGGRDDGRRGGSGDVIGARPDQGGRNSGSQNHGEASLADLPPAYHEAVGDDRHTRTETSPQANRPLYRGWPPMYSDVVRPAPVASPPSRAPYPTLPQSPRR